MGDVDLGPFCPVCAEEFDSWADFDEHKTTNEHRLNWLNRKYRQDRINYLCDKEGFSIDVIRNDVNIRFTQNTHTVEVITGSSYSSANDGNDETKSQEFILRIFHNGESPVYLIGIDLLNKNHLVDENIKFKVTDPQRVSERNVHLKLLPTSHYDVKCEIKAGQIARPRHIPILFELFPLVAIDDEPIQPFYIGKTIEIKGAAFNVRQFGYFIPGIRPLKNELNKLIMEIPLGRFGVPLWFQKLAFNNRVREIRKRMSISPIISFGNYSQFFKTLLWLEELQLELDIQFYSKKRITFTFPRNKSVKGVNCVVMKEEGLGEKRPSVMKGDEVLVCLNRDRESTADLQWYQGFVHRVELTDVFIGFSESLFVQKFSEKDLFDVEFCINRYPMRVSHRAASVISQDVNLRSFIFPETTVFGAPLFLPQINPYDQNIKGNEEQMQAIQHIVAGSSGDAPYVVFGPPGTGKTVTVVEAIKQVLYHDDMSHVLACAPSNTATDVIAERLLEHFDKKHVLRIYASSREKHLPTLPAELLKASNYDDEIESIYFPPKEVLMTIRVIVCTLVTAAKICGAGFPKGHFTHVVLDEVGHSTESEALVAVAGILQPPGHLILAGDPHQLGPVVRNLNVSSGSHYFPETGLDTSFLERIMKIKLYSKSNNGRYNPRFVTKLVKNYRSHPTILKIPNDLFYNSELEPRGDPEVINRFANWKFLPQKNFLVLVHAVNGEDQLEQYSPSYHNPQEVKKVILYLKRLLNGVPDISAEDIGIITPYRLQVEKLRYAIRSQCPNVIEKLKVGSVEDFQGEERKVIIISTVRASYKHLQKDDLFKLGFLRNPKRFNVAVTRAQCLLILVGCPKVLMLDNCWKSLIEYAKENGGYIGDPLAHPNQNLDELLKNMKDVDIRPTFGDISAKQIVEVPPMNRY